MLTLADRIWYALHCMPRSPEGEPPTYVDIETAANLSNGTMSKLIRGVREGASLATAARLAKALNVSLGWLQSGDGDAPTPTGIVPPRLPGLVDPSSSLAVAMRLIYEASRENPNASTLELLLQAQLAALKTQK